MVDRVCGWNIPGHPVYVCILPAHGDDVPHQPRWITNETREALAVLRRRGDYVQYSEPPGADRRPGRTTLEEPT